MGRKSGSISKKTSAIYIVLAVVNATVFILMVFENQLDLIKDNAIFKSMNTGTVLNMELKKVLKGEEKFTDLTKRKIVSVMSKLRIRKFAVFNDESRIFFEVIGSRETGRSQTTRQEFEAITKALTKKDFEGSLFYNVVDKDSRRIDIFMPIAFGSGQRASVLIFKPSIYLHEIDRQMQFLIRQCIVIVVLLILIHIGFSVLLSRLIIRPVMDLAEATHRISGGELTARVNIVRDDEIGLLARSFNEMVVALQRYQDEAKGANPLTGLPGNITIANEIDRRLSEGEKIALLYADLDNFKAYNDKYGFTKGDEAILYTRDCFLEAVRQKGTDKTFIGHEGGDDFVAVTPYENWEELAQSIISNFDRDIEQFYNETDAERKYIESVNRQGERQRFPLMSISIPVVSNMSRNFINHGEIVSVVAEMKKFVKKKDGSNYSIDKRTG
ncbi:MAG: HAMP domain-containing protein [Fibrobacterota bacterium]